MHPITIHVGSHLYVLTRAGTQTAGDRVESARARAVLETALRRRDPRLIRRLATELHMVGADPDAIASRALAQLARTGTVGRNLVLMQVQRAEVQRDRVQQPEAPAEAPREDVAEEQEEAPPVKKTTIRVSLFFDGTLNNRANTRERLAAQAANKSFSKTGSYENDESNVSRAETLWVGDSSFEHSFSIYVEGIGTTSGAGDNMYGAATGSGDTGVPAKVTSGLNQVIAGIRELGIAGGEIIERFHIDTFGFSRGAAAARHCVHVALRQNPLKARIEALGHPVEQFEVNFVGLFDTVASYGVKHSNDTRELNLDAITAAKKVVQLAAAEEHRKNFRLTDIRSTTGAGGRGIEIYLPGVHSDVGGGYTDNAADVDLQILDFDVLRSTKSLEARFARERQWLIDTGWYRPAEIQPVSWWNELKVTRRGIRNTYNRIPLRHMIDFASQTGLTFDPPATHFPVPAPLAAIQALVAAHVAAAAGGTRSTAAHWINMRTPEYKRLRHDYLHFSAYYGSTMGANAPQWSAGGAMTGRRQRIVQAG